MTDVLLPLYSIRKLNLNGYGHAVHLVGSNDLLIFELLITIPNQGQGNLVDPEVQTCHR